MQSAIRKFLGIVFTTSASVTKLFAGDVATNESSLPPGRTMIHRNARSIFTALLVGAILAVFATPAWSQTYTWNATTDGNWNVATNWLDPSNNPGIPPSSATTQLVFNASGSVSYIATNDIGSFTLNAITVNNTGTGTVTIAGASPLTFGGTTPAINVSAGLATISEVIAGSTAITKSGAGLLALSGANTFSAGLSVTGGTLALAGNSTTSITVSGFPSGTITNGPVGTGTLTLNGGTLTVQGGNRAIRNAVAIAGTASIIDVPTGFELTTTGATSGGATTALTKNGGGLWRIGGTSSFTGTLTINGGTVLVTDIRNATGGSATGGDFNATNIVVNSGAQFQFGSNPQYVSENPDLPAATIITLNAGSLVQFHIGEDYGGFILRGGTYNTSVNSGLGLTTTLESGTIGGISGEFGSFSGAGLFQKTTAGTVTINGVTLNNSGGLTIAEGILDTTGLIVGSGNITFGSASTAGTLRYNNSTSGTLARPLVINAGGGTLELPVASTTVTLTGAVSGSGPFTKSGPGTLGLSGLLNQTGTMTVAAGALRLNPVTSAGGFIVANGATLAANSGPATATLTVPTISLGSTGSTIQFDLDTTTLPAVPLISVSTADGLTLNGGAHTLRLTDLQSFPTGTMTLIDYAGSPISSGFTLALPGRTTGSLIYDTTNTRIDLNVTATDSIKWSGAINGTWDVGSAPNVGGTNNWTLVIGGTATNFINTDTIRFDDSATGTTTVNLGVSVQPAVMTVDNSTLSYTIQGAGSITGPTALTKLGTGTLILATDNTYTGGTTITAGTLQLGNGGTAGSVTGLISVASNATLGVNRSNDSTFSGLLTGTGNLVKAGAGVFRLTGPNTGFTGAATINGGTLRIEDEGLGGDFNAATITVNNGGRFEMAGPIGNPDLPGTTVIFINTGGVAQFTEAEDFGGFVLQGGAFNTSDLHNLGLTTQLISGTINGLSGSTGGSLGGAGLIQKIGPDTVTITGVTIVNTTAGLAIDEGVLATDSTIGGTGNLSFGTGGTTGTLRFTGTSMTVAKPAAFNNTATVEVTQTAGALTFGAVASGSAGLTKTGPGALYMNGVNTYAGATQVNAGTLGGTGTIATNVAVANGANIRGGNAAGTGTLTLTNGLALAQNAGMVIRVTGGDPSATPGGSTTGTLPNPTSNTYINITGGTLSVLPADLSTLRFVIDGTGTTFTPGQAYSYQVLQITGQDLTSFTISNQAQFTAIGFTASAFSVTGNASGALFVGFTPVPEPMCVIGICGAAMGAGAWIRRRRQSNRNRID